MTVEELRAALENFPAATEVWFWSGSDHQKTVESVKLETFSGYGPKVVELR